MMPAFQVTQARVRSAAGNGQGSPAAGVRRQGGFTFIEAMVVVGIVALMAALAAPSFNAQIQKYRVQGEANMLVGDLQLARAEAIKEGSTVTFCASTNAIAAAPSCSGSSSAWQAGWLVFSDKNNNQQLDAGETVYRAQPAWTSSDTATAAVTAAPSSTVSAETIASLTFNADGFTSSTTLPVGTTVTFTLHTVPVNSVATRCIGVNSLGHMVSGTPATPATTTSLVGCS